jgi:hypothetical protein
MTIEGERPEPGLPEPGLREPEVPAAHTTGADRRDRVPLVVVAVALAALVAIAWVAPAAAIVVIWPVLFVVPGWFLVARAVPAITAAGRTGAAVVVSVYLSAHLVNVVALATGGFSRGAIVAAGAALIALSVILARARLPWLADPPTLSGRAAWLAVRGRRGPWVAAAAAVAIVGFVLGASAWHLVGDGWVSGGTNWSDFLVHVSIGSSIAAGNFPPQVPYFAGEPLTYHWFADFHGAIAATAAGVDIIGVYLATSALFAGALALVTWELAFRLTRSGRVALIATVLVLFGGGMGWIRLVLDLASGAGDLVTLVSRNSYDNSWDPDPPFFHIASVFGTGLLAHRATTLGLPGMVTAVLLAQASLGKRPAGMALAGVVAALLAPFSFFAFPATYLVVGLLFVARRAWRKRTVVRDAVLFVAPAVLALPFILGSVARQVDVGSMHLVAGWSEAPFRDGIPAVVLFYLANLGIPFVLAIAALFYRRMPSRTFLGAWLVALFLVPNVIVATAVAFDMNKYFQAMWVAVGILAAWAIHRWPRPLIVLVVAASVISPALVGSWHVLADSVALTSAQERVGRWIAANTPERSVFLTEAFINSPVDLAGRLRITTFGAYAANLGYDPAPREADVTSAYCNGPDVAAKVMRRYGATYALSFGGYLACPDGGAGTDFASSELFELVHEDEGVDVYRLR